MATEPTFKRFLFWGTREVMVGDPDRKWSVQPFYEALSGIRLSMLTRGSPIVIVVGAGCSCESGVPLGDTIRQVAQKVLPDQFELFKNTSRPKTLEAFLDFVRANIPGDSQRFVARFLADAGIPGRDDVPILPTLLHMQVARLAACGVAPLIVSLNFDELLERCLCADIGLPGDIATAGEICSARWVCCVSPNEWEHLWRIDEATSAEANRPCVLLKPHGTISRPETLVAAGRDVAEFPPSVARILKRYLEDSQATFLFLGCSFRDADFQQLYDAIPVIEAQAVVFECKALQSWLDTARAANASGQHAFDLPSFEKSRIVFARCGSAIGGSCGAAPGESISARITTSMDSTPGQSLLELMSSASDSTGNLSKQNAPSVADILLHDWVRRRLVGVRPALESFLATEILIGAAIENGIFNRERLLSERRHLKLAVDRGFDGLVTELLERFVESGVLLQESDGQYALGRIHGPELSESLPALLGPLEGDYRSADFDMWLDRVRALLGELAEQKATRSHWLTDSPGELLAIERATVMVLDTTNELSVVSEYGTWMRRDRFRKAFIEASRRSRESTRVIIASPPPANSQGYLEWLSSALWLWTNPDVELRVLESEQHRHHMNLGQQVGIDFLRKGTSNKLADGCVRFGARDKRELRRVFTELEDRAETFAEWQLKRSLHANFGDFAVQYVVSCPLDKVVVKHSLQFDRFVDGDSCVEAQHSWEQANQQRIREGRPALEAKPLFRPCAASLSGDGLVIHAGRTTYFDNHFLQCESSSWNEESIVGAGISVVPICSDQTVLVGQRASIVDAGQGQYHVAGGHAHPRDDFEDSADTLCSAAYEELFEEMHVTSDDVLSLDFLGLVVDLVRSKPEFVVAAKLRNSGDHYVRRWKEARGKVEGQYGGVPEFSVITTIQELLGKDGLPSRQDGDVASLMPAVWRNKRLFVTACRAALMVSCLQRSGPQITTIEDYLA